jgi:hypothetical protein
MTKQIPYYVSESIKSDGIFLMRLLKTFSVRHDSPLLSFAILPIASRFVIESYNRLIEYESDWRSHISDFEQNLILSARHKSKLLITNSEDIHTVISGFQKIIEREKEDFENSHTGFLEKLKRFVQPDLGIFMLESHIISSTHAARFTLGGIINSKEDAHNSGYTIGNYCAELLNYFEKDHSDSQSFNSKDLPVIKMKDIKHLSLYKRGLLGKLNPEVSGLITVILANVNFIHHVLRRIEFPQSNSLVFFKLKFLCAFHAQKSLQILQGILVPSGQMPTDTFYIFEKIFSNVEAKWLRKQDKLRDFLVHYQSNNRNSIPHNTSYNEVLSSFFKDKSFNEINSLIDTQLENISVKLQKGFDLTPRTFWYGFIIIGIL